MFLLPMTGIVPMTLSPLRKHVQLKQLTVPVELEIFRINMPLLLDKEVVPPTRLLLKTILLKQLHAFELAFGSNNLTPLLG